MSRRYSLDARIWEVRREISVRRANLSRWAKAQGLRETEAEYTIAVLEDVLDTLLWLRRDERLIQQRLGY